MLEFVVQSKASDIARRAREYAVNQPLKPLCDMLVELKELHQLGHARARVNQIAHQIIHRLEQEAPQYMGTMNVESVQEVVRWGLSQATMDRLLLLAVQNNRPLTVIQALVARKANVHQICEGGRTLLMEAAMHSRHQAVVDYFLEQDLNPRQRDENGLTARALAGRERRSFLPNTFFPYEGTGGTFSFFAFGYLLLAHEAEFLEWLSIKRYPMFLSSIFALGISLWNTTIGEVEERNNLEPRYNAIGGELEGVAALSFANNVFGTGPLPLALLYLITWFVDCDDRTVQSILIDYVGPLARVINVVSLIGVIVLENMIFGAVMLTVYATSLLDRYGYLPVSIQKIYYFVLWLLFALPMQCIFEIELAIARCICGER